MGSRLHVRWGNLPHVTSPTWGPPPSCKQALRIPYLECSADYKGYIVSKPEVMVRLGAN